MQKSRIGFTLIELMVVISIIGILVGLLLPAVQYAREAARRAQCQNNLKQLALGAINFESQHRHLPSGGWGKRWSGLPGLGGGREQPGGWIYNVLPFIEQGNLHALGGTDPEDAVGNAQRVATPLGTLHCPTRRAPGLFPKAYAWNPPLHSAQTHVARNDYAINGGTVYIETGEGPDSLTASKRFLWPSMQLANGLSHMHSEIRMADVSDGLSMTYLVGEKHVRHEDYQTGQDWGDNEGAYSGDALDIVRYGALRKRMYLPPISDRSGTMIGGEFTGMRFGSAHASGFQVSHLDGSVHHVSFSVDPKVHASLCARNDAGQVETQN